MSRRCVPAIAALLLAGLLPAGSAPAASLLMVSVDADAHHLKIPVLRGLARDGVAARVTGVWPTVTYPSHTTLITGVWPAEHGIEANLQFDPRHVYGEAWYWYAQEIRVPTLWQAAHARGLRTASVGWPVSVGAPVDQLIPEYWRMFRPAADLNPSDTALMAALARPDGSLNEMQSRLGPYLRGNDPYDAGDAIKTRFALDILKRTRPQFMTVHLSALDEEEHEQGPFSAAANAQLERIDGWLGELIAAARANDPDSIALVVSDHGFMPVTHRVNLAGAFRDAGLIDTRADARGGTEITAWKAQLWLAGGMAAVMLQDPGDAVTRAAVRALAATLKADPANGIAEVLEGAELARRGGFAGAALLLVMQPGYLLSQDPGAPRVAEVRGSTPGGHGFSPEDPAMRASFFMAGHGIGHKDLGVIDMRRIAPTVAGLLQLDLPSARAAPLPVQP
jgi:Type I phosphodiesterase / nucleotide pyrophosphatase